MSPHLPAGVLLGALLLHGRASAQSPDGAAPPQDLSELSLEELMNVDVQVTSASLHEQPLSKTPAAVFVLTSEDIRRSGATSIPELLRVVPGVDVARLDSNRWAVSIRGFNGQFANQILVLVDGRSVYTPLFSGTFWDTLDVPLENIERIEVIRGPGAALWGANAVNGVVNIITKEASATQGTLVSGTLGNEDRFLGFVRHGAELGSGHWNAWAHYTDRGPTGDPAGGDGGDAWQLFHAGVRLDQSPSERDRWLLTAEAYNGSIRSRETLAAPPPVYQASVQDDSAPWGATLMSRWTRSFGERDELSLQAYADHTDRRLELFVEQRTTAGLEFRRRQPLSETHDLTWGASLRTSHSATEDTFVLGWSDNSRTDTMAGTFVQDEIVLEPQRWTLTLGAKLEHVDISGWNVQPDLRLLYTPNERESWWAGISHTVRTPSQAEQDVTLLNAIVPGAPDQYVTLFGDREVEPESQDSFQLGYRTRPSESVSLDATAYYNHYSHQIVFEPGTPFLSGGNLVVPLVARNQSEAHSFGFELAGDWTPREDTRLSLSWSLQELQVDAHGSAAPNAHDDEGLTPENMLHLGLRHDIDERFAFDSTLHWIDRLETDSIPAYWRLDARLEYRSSPQQCFELGVQNVLHDGEPEFGPSYFNASNKMDTALYLRATWSF